MGERLPTVAQWFSDLGACAGCDKRATGWLMNNRNEKLGVYCDRCAKASLKLSDKARNP